MSVESNDGSQPIIVREGEGQMFEAFGDTIQVKLGGAQTGNSLAVGLGTTPPGGGPPPHLHRNEDELFLTLEGRISFLANGEWTEVGPGSVVYIPKGAVHTFRNVGDSPCRQWILTSPSGFENFFGRCAAVFAEGGAPDMARILTICQEHGIEILAPAEEAKG